MKDLTVAFLERLLSTPGPSSSELDVSRLWRQEASQFADVVNLDVQGNSIAILEGETPRVLLTAHIDEIGLMISYVDEDGFLYFSPIGNWDPEVLVGQRVRLQGRTGPVIGVVGKKASDLMDDVEKTKRCEFKNMWIDIGTASRTESLESIALGSTGVVDAPIYNLPNSRLVSRSLDNRIGAFIILEVLRQLSLKRPAATVAAIATSREEIALAGAMTSTFAFEPHLALVIDVTDATDHPETDKRVIGEVRLNAGPVLSKGSANSPVVFEMLSRVAEEHHLPYSVTVHPEYTGTDADVVYISRNGVATALISIPNRYMHSPNEMVALSDVEQTIKLCVEFIRALPPDIDLRPA